MGSRFTRGRLVNSFVRTDYIKGGGGLTGLVPKVTFYIFVNLLLPFLLVLFKNLVTYLKKMFVFPSFYKANVVNIHVISNIMYQNKVPTLVNTKLFRNKRICNSVMVTYL